MRKQVRLDEVVDELESCPVKSCVVDILVLRHTSFDAGPCRVQQQLKGRPMRTILRGVIALLGLFNLAIGLGFLVAPEKLAQGFYLAPLGTQGLATVRADFPGFFIGVAVFALVGAWTGRARPLLVPLLMLGVALFGRFVSLAIDGMTPTAPAPMIAEAVMLTILFAGWRWFDRPTP